MTTRANSFLLAVVCVLVVPTSSLEKPEEMSDEMYCLGCQVVVKELDFMLSKKPTRGMGETVTRALQRVCDVHNFNKYEVDSKKVLQVCNHIKGDEGMEAVLITEYGRKHATGKQTTYLDITNMICGTVLKACYAHETMENNDKDGNGGITFDPETEEFLIKHGKKVRTAKPVAESEPNQTSKKTGSKPETSADKTEDKMDEKVRNIMDDTEVKDTAKIAAVEVEVHDQEVTNRMHETIINEPETESHDEL